MKIAYEKIYDIAVVGGGIAGVAAALQAARCGMKTVLIEKTVLPGGLATTGLVRVYLPLCDGNGHQVSFGITEELLRASYKYGPGDIPENWKNGKMRRNPGGSVPCSPLHLSFSLWMNCWKMPAWIFGTIPSFAMPKWKTTGSLRSIAKTLPDAAGSLQNSSSMPAATAP